MGSRCYGYEQIFFRFACDRRSFSFPRKALVRHYSGCGQPQERPLGLKYYIVVRR